MCGTTDFSDHFSDTLLHRVNVGIAYGGEPDERGNCIMQGHDIGFAHSRLSIIDLFPRSVISRCGMSPPKRVIVFTCKIFDK